MDDFDVSLEDFFHYLGVAAIIFGLLYGIYSLVFYLVVRRRGNPESDLVRKKRKMLHFPVFFLSIVIGLELPIPFMNLPVEIVPILQKVLNVAFIGTLSWTLIEGVGVVKYLVLKQYDIEVEDNLKARKVYTQFRIIERVVVFTILIVGISLMLMSFDSIRKIGVSLIASAGIAGIILGLAAQKILGTVLAGIQIAIAQPIRIEDAVVVEGEWGWIEEINLTYVVVRLWDKRRLVLPTNYFIEKPFQNWTRTSSDIVGSVFLYVDYRMPMDPLREELDRLLDESPLWDRKAKVLQVTDAKESTVEIRILVSAQNSPTAWDLRVHVREKMIEFIQQNYPDYLPRTRVMMVDKNATEG
ncbi:MAG: mechanosensitive ion channel family protein [Bacteroidia bacterium]|nr:mechanosensitive ion channel family protein [Bacteroidia bacterium]